MFLKEKRTGEVKRRGCADSRLQRDYMTKEQNSAPTVSIKALKHSCVIDTMERRDDVIVDIPGAFMQANMDDVFHLKMEGRLAECLVKLEPIPKCGEWKVNHACEAQKDSLWNSTVSDAVLEDPN